MEDDGFICPYPWKWNEIHERLTRAWQERCADILANQPPPEEAPVEEVAEVAPAASAGLDSDFDLDFEEEERAWDAPVAHKEEAPPPPIPEPPHLLAPTSTDAMRRVRWQETLAWAEEHGFMPLIGHLAESDKYYAP
jgi:hypothetical protein